MSPRTRVDDDLDLEEEDENLPSEEDEFKDLRRKARKADKLEKELTTYRKRDAFHEAGVDLSNPVGELLFDTWAADLDVEAIKTKAESVGALKAPVAPPPAGPSIEADEQEATAARQELAAGAEPDQGKVFEQKPDPQQQARDVATDAIKGGSSEEDALAAGLGSLLESAVAGDDRVIWDPNA